MQQFDALQVVCSPVNNAPMENLFQTSHVTAGINIKRSSYLQRSLNASFPNYNDENHWRKLIHLVTWKRSICEPLPIWNLETISWKKKLLGLRTHMVDLFDKGRSYQNEASILLCVYFNSSFQIYHCFNEKIIHEE